MFKAENTGSTAWKRIIDESGKAIADLDESYNGDWFLVRLNSREKLTEDSFSNGSRAASWLWKNRKILGEPFNLYEEKEKPSKKSKKPEPIIIEEEPTEDLFWNYKK